MKSLAEYKYFETANGILYHGDCLEIMPLLESESIDLVLTDPPYGINYLSSWTENHDVLKNDKLDDWNESFEKWIIEYKRVLTKTGCCCCCCCGGGKTPVSALATIMAIKHFNLIQTVIWRKFIGVGWRYRPAYETVLILSKHKDNYNFYDTSKSCSNVIEKINQDIPNAEEHPTQKPVALMEKFLNIHSKQGDTVLDAFMGGGSTAVACEKQGRKWIGIEINEGYCEIAKKRIDAENRQGKMF